MKKRAASKIRLTRETIRRLENRELAPTVHGGDAVPNELPASLMGPSCWECPVVKPPFSGDYCG